MKATRICVVPDCGGKHYSLGYCQLHYGRVARHGDPYTVKKGGPPRKPKVPCSVDGCAAVAKSKGMCSAHLNRFLRHGDPNVKLLPYFGVPFWERATIVHDADSCWNWHRTSYRDGRGRIRWNGRSKMAYRVAWMLTYGDIPEGLLVCHRCDNPRCIRPSHLFLGTAADNSQDMVSKGRAARGRHNFTEGDAHHRTRWSDAEIQQIRERHSAGITQAQLVRETGISQTHMSRILNRESRRSA